MLVALGGFQEGIGRVGCRPLGCEETDLFIRLAQRWPAARVVYDPEARVRHTVPPARLSWRYFRSRCFAEGLSKASVAARVGSHHALAAERSYTLKVLPAGMARGLRDACRGHQGAGLRAIAIGAGLAMTTAGYVTGQLSASFTRKLSPQPSKVGYRSASA
jgi:F0F1-type ATP synthase membrane subunit c/vacuolar-type H+-ATPase subunit K